MDDDLHKKDRVVLVFGERNNTVGLLASRVANGPGGINKGSMISVVRELRNQKATRKSSSAPGIVLANTGQLYWWPEGKRALTLKARPRIPLPSIVHAGYKPRSELNSIPGQETGEQHIQYMFDHVVKSKTAGTSIIDVIAIGNTCDKVQKFLDKHWNDWASRLSSLLLVDTILEADKLTNDSFKHFLEKVCGVYFSNLEPVAILTHAAVEVLPSF